MLTRPPWKDFNLRIMIFSELGQGWWNEARILGPIVRTDVAKRKYLKERASQGSSAKDAWRVAEVALDGVDVLSRYEGVDGGRMERSGNVESDPGVKLVVNDGQSCVTLIVTAADVVCRRLLSALLAKMDQSHRSRVFASLSFLFHFHRNHRQSSSHSRRRVADVSHTESSHFRPLRHVDLFANLPHHLPRHPLPLYSTACHRSRLDHPALALRRKLSDLSGEDSLARSHSRIVPTMGRIRRRRAEEEESDRRSKGPESESS